MCNFGSLKNPFVTITSLPELYFRFRRFILLVQTKKKISLSYGSSRSCRKPWRWVRFQLILTMRDIYINSNLNPLIKFTSSSRSTEFKDILPLNTSQMILEKKLFTEENQCLYNKCKQDLEEIYDNIAQGICIRSRCQW